jgi:hypothetical protein
MRALAISLLFVATTANAFLEDICLPRRSGEKGLSFCIRPNCPGDDPNRSCPGQVADFASIKPGRSMIHADSTFFIAQALGYRADVAYWIAAYDEVTDYGQYIPIDQCGVQASKSNSGANYISSAFNGFVRTNVNTDGPLDHYVVPFSPNGQGTDAHGAMGVQALYPLHYPRPGYPERIDDTYQKTLANLRQWAMIPTSDPGLLCTVGLTTPDNRGCISGINITGKVPSLMRTNIAAVPISVAAGKKVLNLDTNTKQVVYYDQLQNYLDDTNLTTGTLWKDPRPVPVPVQVARFGLYIHVLQDTDSHSTYCGDDGPTPPGGCDSGTYMYLTKSAVNLSFGNSCAVSPHLAGHAQETGTGDHSLPLRDYVALNMTVDELIVFGNEVALKHPGWIVNPSLLPPDVTGGKSAQGMSAADLQKELVGTIVKGEAYTRAEVYKSGVVTLPLQQTKAMDRLHAMNSALGSYSDTVAGRVKGPFVPFEPMPGNSFDKANKSVCWK